MLGVVKRKEVKALLREHRAPVVARLAGVSLSSVKRISREADIPHLDDEAERKRRGIGRPSKIRGFRWSIEQILDRKPDIRSVDILRHVRLMGYTGGKTSLYSLVAALRAETGEHRRQSDLPAQASSAGAEMSSFGLG